MTYQILCTIGDKSPIQKFGAYRKSFQSMAISSDQVEEVVGAYDGIDEHTIARKPQVLGGRS